MKLSRKIIPALAMLVVAAVMLTTASFAWFAMSKTVEAREMSVNIKSDSLFLLISSDKTTAAEIQTQNKTVANGVLAAGSTGDLFPTAHVEEVSGSPINGTQFDAPANWYTKGANDVGSSASSKDPIALSSSNFGQYVAKYTFYVVLAENSNSAQNLKVNSFSIAASADSAAEGDALTLDPVRAVITCGTNYVEVKSGDSAPATVLSNTVDNTNVLTVNVYIYYDGNDEDVYSNNIMNIQDVDFTFTLSVEA